MGPENYEIELCDLARLNIVHKTCWVSSSLQLSQKIFPVLRKLRKKIAQNRAKLIAFHAQK